MVNMAIVTAMGAEQGSVPHLLSTEVDTSPQFREAFDASVVHVMEETTGSVKALIAHCQDRSAAQAQIGTTENTESKDAAFAQLESAATPSVRPQTALARERYSTGVEGQAQAAVIEDSVGPKQQSVDVSADERQLSFGGKPPTAREGGQLVASTEERNVPEQAASTAISDRGIKAREKVKDIVRHASNDSDRGSEKSSAVKDTDKGHWNDKSLKDEPKIKRHKWQLSGTSNDSLKTVQNKSLQESPTNLSFALQSMQSMDQGRSYVPSSEQVRPETEVSASGLVSVTNKAVVPVTAGRKYQIDKAPIGLKERTSTADETSAEVRDQHVATQSQARPFSVTKASGELPTVPLPDKAEALRGRMEGHVSSSLSSPLAERSQVLSGPVADKPLVANGIPPLMIAHVERSLIEPQLTVAGNRALVTTPTAIEVGVPGGSHGWLKVRAELASDGAVHASVFSTSEAGAEMLRRELPSLTTYLHQEQVPVNSVVVHASPAGQETSAMAGGSNQSGTGPSGHGDAQQNRGGQEGTVSVEVREPSARDLPDELSAGWLPESAPTAGRGWLSVRA
jgi:hypothetical protein